MKVYILQRSDGLYYCGNRGWRAQPRIFRIGALKSSIRHTPRAFSEFDHFKTWSEFFQTIAAFGGNVLNMLPGERYTIKEFVIE